MGAAKHKRETPSCVKGSRGLTVLDFILPDLFCESQKGAMVGEVTPLQ